MSRGLYLLIAGALLLALGWIPLIAALKWDWFPDSNLVGGLGPLAWLSTPPAAGMILAGVILAVRDRRRS